MKKIAPLTVISGGVDYLCNRHIQQMILEAKNQKLRILSIPAGDEDALEEAFSSASMMPAFVVIESANLKKKTSKATTVGWSESALEAVLEHIKNFDGSLYVVVYHPSDSIESTFAGLIAPHVPKEQVREYPAPKPWKEKEVLSKFLRSELKRRGKVLSLDLSEQIVARVGVDYGLLSFEALKISTLLDFDKRVDVLPADAGAVMAAFGSEDWENLKTHLANKNEKGVLKALAEIRKGPGGDSIAKVTAILSSVVVKWLHAAALLDSGLAPKDAADRMGVNDFRFNLGFLPAAQTWGSLNLKKFFRTLMGVSVRKGHMAPWIALEVALVRGCHSK